MQKWEYLEVRRIITQYVSTINGGDVEKQNIQFYDYINKLGQEGWELVTAADRTFLFFERPKL